MGARLGSFRPVRVGIVCPYSLTLPGGVQGQVLGLARALQRSGVQARVLGPCDGPPPDPSVTPLGRSIPTASNGSLAAIAPDPAAALRTVRALRDERFDVLNIHEPLTPGPSLTALVTAFCPTVGTFHRSGPSGWLDLTRPLASYGSSYLDVRVAVSEEARDTAAEAVGGDYELVWNGIDVARYEGSPAWETKGPTVLFVGRHEPRKGLEVLLRAAQGLGGGVRLWIAGQGPDTDRLKRLYGADTRIEWLGRIGEAEKIARLRGADVLCAPSLGGESFGVVLLEGLAAGTPVVASDLAGYRRVARSGQEAILVAPGDVAALSGALAEALSATDRVGSMVRRGQLRAEEFSMEALSQRYMELFELAVRRRAEVRQTYIQRLANRVGSATAEGRIRSSLMIAKTATRLELPRSRRDWAPRMPGRSGGRDA